MLSAAAAVIDSWIAPPHAPQGATRRQEVPQGAALATAAEATKLRKTRLVVLDIIGACNPSFAGQTSGSTPGRLAQARPSRPLRGSKPLDGLARQIGTFTKHHAVRLACARSTSDWPCPISGGAHRHRAARLMRAEMRSPRGRAKHTLMGHVIHDPSNQSCHRCNCAKIVGPHQPPNRTPGYRAISAARPFVQYSACPIAFRYRGKGLSHAGKAHHFASERAMPRIQRRRPAQL